MLMKTAKCVLLIESGHFIGGVIHSLFANYEQLCVIEAAPTNVRDLLSEVRKHRPEIIVLDDTVRPDFLERLLHYMQTSGNIRVVMVHTEQNEIEVYQKQQVSVRQSTDFFAAL